MPSTQQNFSRVHMKPVVNHYIATLTVNSVVSVLQVVFRNVEIFRKSSEAGCQHTGHIILTCANNSSCFTFSFVCNLTFDTCWQFPVIHNQLSSKFARYIISVS